MSVYAVNWIGWMIFFQLIGLVLYGIFRPIVFESLSNLTPTSWNVTVGMTYGAALVALAMGVAFIVIGGIVYMVTHGNENDASGLVFGLMSISMGLAIGALGAILSRIQWAVEAPKRRAKQKESDAIMAELQLILEEPNESA